VSSHPHSRLSICRLGTPFRKEHLMATIVVAGLGRVGSLDDANRPKPPRSHIGNILATPGLRLVAAIDSDPAVRHAARNQWQGLGGTDVLGSLAELEPGTIDILVLATPTIGRLQDVAAAVALRPKALLIEKPLAKNLSEAISLLPTLRSSGSLIRINYMRRFAPAIQSAMLTLPTGATKVVLRYSGGLMNMASHGLDLLIGRFGAIRSVTASPIIGEELGAGADDGLDFRVRFDSGDLAFGVSLGAVAFSELSLDFLSHRGRLEITDNGVSVRWHVPRIGAIFPGYAGLAYADDLATHDHDLGMPGLYCALRDAVSHQRTIGGTTLEQGLHICAVIDAIRRSAAEAGREIAVDRLDFGAK